MAWLWIVFTLITDLLRDGMHGQAMRVHAESRSFDRAVEQTRRALPTDELDLLHGLQERGNLTDVEFEAARARRSA